MAVSDSPVMLQYKQLKTQHPECLLFFRMGDFYELFHEDAVTAHSILGVTLTRRRTAKAEDEGIPMCGVPFHAAEGYIAKLVKSGHRVALAEQLETPDEAKKRVGKSTALVRRDVVRVFTGATLTEDSMLPNDATALLAALVISDNPNDERFALAWVDLAGAQVGVQEGELSELSQALNHHRPAELLLHESAQALLQSEAVRRFGGKLSAPVKDNFVGKMLPSFIGSPLAQQALNQALGYIHFTQKGQAPTLTFQKPGLGEGTSADVFTPCQTALQIDAASQRNLELLVTQKGEVQGSLFAAIKHTQTSAGARLLRQWLAAPASELSTISQRQKTIGALHQKPLMQEDIRAALKETADLARAVSRLTLGRGSPRDVQAVGRTILGAQAISNLLPQLNAGVALEITHLSPLAETIIAALHEDVPLLARDGGFLKSGFSETFDHYNNLKTNGLHALQALEADTIAKTNLPLKVKYNKVWGHFFEMPKSQEGKVPDWFIHRQTTTNQIRYTTHDLMALAQELSSAGAEVLAAELAAFETLVANISDHAIELVELAHKLAAIDVLCAGSELMFQQQWALPTLTEDTTFCILGGQHPVVAQAVETFMANNCDLSGGQLHLLTGPNMAGKSTFLRQQALIVILAHMGFPVPATQAEIGLVDKIFTRIGAADDLAAGQSTFMVEMVETAAIVQNATAKSLVILDEVGRGTATYDGLAIAQAVVEYLLTYSQCRGLFATHYHELTALEKQFPNIRNFHLTVKEWQGQIVFLHTVQKGAAPRSYGVHVAKLAGLPESVITRAEILLANLEKQRSITKTLAKPAVVANEDTKVQDTTDPLPLFA